MDNQALSHLIGQIYDSAVRPELWPQTLSNIRIATGYFNIGLTMMALPTSKILLNVVDGVPPEYLDIESRDAEVLEAWGGAAMVASYPLDRPVVLSQVRPDRAYLKERYFLEWAGPQGIVDCVALQLVRDNSTVCAIALAWHESAGELTPEKLEMPTLLLPHLQRALNINRLLDLQALVAQTFAATLDQLNKGAVLLDRDMSIVHANEAARTLFSARDLFRNERGRLVLAPSAAQSALANAVAAAADNERDIGKRGLGVPLRRGDGAPMMMHVLPLKFGGVRPALAPSAVAAVFFAPAATLVAAPEAALAVLFDLTPAEAKVFASLASGASIADTARSLGIATSTAKTHLLQLFQKTGTHRQAELVKLAGSLSL